VGERGDVSWPRGRRSPQAPPAPWRECLNTEEENTVKIYVKKMEGGQEQ